MFNTLPDDAQTLATWSWDRIQPYYADLLGRDLTPATVNDFLHDWCALGRLMAEMGTRHYVAITVNTADAEAQAAYESQMAIWGALMGGAHLLNHAAGWMHGGLTASFEKLILDAELLQMQAEFLTPLDLSADALGLEAIAEVGPAGHFFGTAHTLARYETAFYHPILSDGRNYENWQDDGGKTATQRANTIWKQLLNDYEKPPIDPAVEEELEAYVARRKEQILPS